MTSRLLAQLRLVFDPPPEPFEPPPPPMPRLVRHPRARRYVLRVLADGTPSVTIPRWGSKREALAFLDAQHDWVIRQRAKQAERARAQPAREWLDGRPVLVGGRTLILREGVGTRPGVVEQDDVLIVTPRRRDGGDLRHVASAWMLARARRTLPPRLLSLAAAFGLDVTHVSIRNQRARWGSCATGGRISLNWRLVQAPDAVRDYVLIHELMHLRQPNHSRRFWALVARACPDYEVSRRWLRAHEAALLDAR
jgi:predicted metal-dependent hydrolase